MQKEPKECKTTWPICIETMEKSDKTRGKSLFVYRVNNITDRIISNYYDTNKKESLNKNQDITGFNSSRISRITSSNNNNGIISIDHTLSLSNSINIDYKL